MNGPNDHNETNLPLSSNCMPRTFTAASSTHGTSHGTTAATSSCDLRDLQPQQEDVSNKSKNKRLMDELAKLKQEINMLKQLQHDQSHLTINQSQLPTNNSQMVTSNRSKFSTRQVVEYEELLVENA